MIVSFNPLRKGSSPAVAQPSINKFLWPAPECCRFFTKLEAVSSYLLNITREGGGEGEVIIVLKLRWSVKFWSGRISQSAVSKHLVNLTLKAKCCFPSLGRSKSWCQLEYSELQVRALLHMSHVTMLGKGWDWRPDKEISWCSRGQEGFLVTVSRVRIGVLGLNIQTEVLSVTRGFIILEPAYSANWSIFLGQTE